MDALHGSIITYLGRLSLESLTRGQSEQLHDYMATANYIENIGDIIETNLVEVGAQRLKRNIRISESTQDLLMLLHEKVCWTVERALEALIASDGGMAEEVITAKDEINRLADEAEQHLARRLTVEAPDRLAVFRIESEVVEYLKRVYYFAKRIAKVTAETDVIYGKMEDGRPQGAA